MIKENKVSQSIESLAKVVNIAKVTIGTAKDCGYYHSEHPCFFSNIGLFEYHCQSGFDREYWDIFDGLHESHRDDVYHTAICPIFYY